MIIDHDRRIEKERKRKARVWSPLNLAMDRKNIVNFGYSNIKI